ncbi:hypothetical protein ACIPSE_24660 [Streptomyces sp. NPDC090106]|uniref:hypothetical protein n=1 Tax=Streptomyces sp. NPDC090106 TaxID=3365946 RepID=UPI00381A2420
MQVVNVYGQKVGVVAKVVDWRLQPHPQSPDEGDRVHFHYRFDDDAFGSEHAVDVCAVDNERVALGCQIVSSAGAFGPGGIDTGDEWLSVEDPSQVAAVLMIPNDQSYLGRSCAQDAKDGGGPHPPAPAGVGDQL